MHISTGALVHFYGLCTTTTSSSSFEMLATELVWNVYTREMKIYDSCTFFLHVLFARSFHSAFASLVCSSEYCLMTLLRLCVVCASCFSLSETEAWTVRANEGGKKAIYADIENSLS